MFWGRNREIIEESLDSWAADHIIPFTGLSSNKAP